MRRHDKHILEFNENEFLSFFKQADRNNADYTSNEWAVEAVKVSDDPRHPKSIVVVLRQREVIDPVRVNYK